jgi:maltose alpha-D-glucosyltransferase/alpha-amylase
MQLYGRGVRRRLAPMLGEQRRLEFAYSLLFSLPGAPVVRYGEEIGMGENLRLKERDAIRTPMQWSATRNGGFSTADKLVRPAIEAGPYGYQAVNVEDQLRRRDSLLRWMIELVRVRKQTPEIGAGRWHLIKSSNAHVLALRYDLKGSTVVCVHNFDDRPHKLTISLDGHNHHLRSLLDDDESRGSSSGAHQVQLQPYGYRWYRATRS